MRAAPTAKIIRIKKHQWGLVTAVQEELSKQYIHEGLKIKELAKGGKMDTGLASATVNRFFYRGFTAPVGKKSNGHKGYNFMYGPRATTVFGIADALGFNMVLHRRNSKNGRR